MKSKQVVWLYGLKQSCLDARGWYPVSSVEDIDLKIHWIDQAKFAADKQAYWLELVIEHGAQL